MGKSPLEQMIDATVRCLCCGARGMRSGCGCPERGEWCPSCGKCADHCRMTAECDAAWRRMAAELGISLAEAD